MVDTAPPSSTPTTVRWTQPGAFTADISHHHDRVMVLLAGELDIATAPLLGKLLTTAGAGSAVHITLDLSRLAFIDVTGLTTILHARSALQSQQGDLTIRAPSRCVRRLLELANLTGLVTTTPTNREAERRW